MENWLEEFEVVL